MAGYAAFVTIFGTHEAFEAALDAPPGYKVFDMAILSGLGVLRGASCGLVIGWEWPIIVPAVAAKYVLAK